MDQRSADRSHPPRRAPDTQDRGIAGARHDQLSATSTALNNGPAVQRLQMLSPSPRPSMQVVQRALVTDQEITGQKGQTYSWTSFRGTRTDAQDGSASESGRGAKTHTGQDWNSSISWQPVDHGSGEGLAVDAAIGPDHNLGSNPSAANAVARVKAFKDISGKSYISGHLLNEKLGGPGDDPRNLTAIPGSANTLQSTHIEAPVRDPVNEKGHWMHYSVGITYADDSKIFSGKSERVRAKKIRNTKALGISATPYLGGDDFIVRARYAQQLKASWFNFDVDAGRATHKTTLKLKMDSPLTDGEPVLSKPKFSGNASGKEAARTKIDAEELVLTTSNLLKHVVDNRAPLIVRITELRKNIDTISASEGEKQAAIELLNKNAAQLGGEAGYHYAYYEALSAHGLAFAPNQPDMVDFPAFYKGYEQGVALGKINAAHLIRGYDDGMNQGWSDEPRQPHDNDPQYKKGYERGYQDGLDRGDYKSGNKYVFNGISLLKNINEWNQNVFWHAWGSATVELTGHWYNQSNGPRWYEITLVSSVDPNLEEFLEQKFWMKRAWLKKGR